MEIVDYAQMATNLKVDAVFVNENKEVFTDFNRALLSVAGDKTKLEVHDASKATLKDAIKQSVGDMIEEIKARMAAKIVAGDSTNPSVDTGKAVLESGADTPTVDTVPVTTETGKKGKATRATAITNADAKDTAEGSAPVVDPATPIVPAV